MAESDGDAEAALYEYDAPSQVVDLKELQDAEGDDGWFGATPEQGRVLNSDAWRRFCGTATAVVKATLKISLNCHHLRL
ncbi:unnamed protein product [Tetraodon nigroviridis]|uniref:(spotted green pufferfish) hypothetical protein n=1 Tax=Tetraodon nigroviridis TaxID=99883 RepID=Q4T773_TETNG|nr:unnamed protein product [Tetraodon nigroviridis]